MIDDRSENALHFGKFFVELNGYRYQLNSTNKIIGGEGCVYIGPYYSVIPPLPKSFKREIVAALCSSGSRNLIDAEPAIEAGTLAQPVITGMRNKSGCVRAESIRAISARDNRAFRGV